MSPPDPDEQALRTELAEVRDQMLWDVAAEVPRARELVGATGPVVAVVGAAVIAGTVSETPSVAERGDASYWFAQVLLLCIGLLMVYGGWWLIRPYVRRRTADLREFRRLRRELALLGQLPAGTTGRGVYRRYVGRFFGAPALLGLWALGRLCVVVVVVVTS